MHDMYGCTSVMTLCVPTCYYHCNDNWGGGGKLLVGEGNPKASIPLMSEHVHQS